MQNGLKRFILALATVGTIVIAGSLAGCGVRGSLDAPQAAQQSGQATSSEAADAGEGSAAPKKAHRPFILDGLL